MSETVRDFYARPGPMTDLSGVDEDLLAGLPETDVGLCTVSRGLIVHEFLADAYGIGDVFHRFDELETRDVGEITSTLVGLDPRPIAETRPPEFRMIGNCRQYSVLTCALLRRAGIPARVRAGFSGYFDDTWVDHWVVERWDAEIDGWVKTDSQLDETQKQIFGIDFDPLRVPDDGFLSGSEAWHRYRAGEDPQLFGIQDLRGPWFIAASAIRDLAALNKVEVHVWDTWGVIDDLVFRDLTGDQVRLIDEISAVVEGNRHEDIVRLYARDGLRVPGEVTSSRFQRKVALGL